MGATKKQVVGRGPGRPPKADAKRGKNMRLSPSAWAQLDAIADHFGGNRTAAAEAAFGKLFAELVTQGKGPATKAITQD
jgi:hypothetical protein